MVVVVVVVLDVVGVVVVVVVVDGGSSQLSPVYPFTHVQLHPGPVRALPAAVPEF